MPTTAQLSAAHESLWTQDPLDDNYVVYDLDDVEMMAQLADEVELVFE
jgi:ribonuclease D